MLGGEVIGHDVDDDAQAAVVRGVDQCARVIEAAIHRIDIARVAYVVPRVVLRGGVERRQPDGIDTQRGDVGHALDHSREVAGAVSVGVGE